MPGSGGRAKALASQNPHILSNLVPNSVKLRWLQTVAFIGFVGREVRLDRAAAAVRIPVEAETAERSVASLPPGNFFSGRQLARGLSRCGRLLAKLFELSPAVGNDFEAFQAVVEGQP